MAAGSFQSAAVVARSPANLARLFFLFFFLSCENFWFTRLFVSFYISLFENSTINFLAVHLIDYLFLLFIIVFMFVSIVVVLYAVCTFSDGVDG